MGIAGQRPEWHYPDFHLHYLAASADRDAHLHHLAASADRDAYPHLYQDALSALSYLSASAYPHPDRDALRQRTGHLSTSGLP